MDRSHPLNRARLVPTVFIVATLAGCGGQKGTPAQPPEEACERYLRDIGDAIAQYTKIHGALPAVVSGPNASEHSWRMAIMPYLDRSDLGKLDYRMYERWDSPHNRDALVERPIQFYFSCPAERRNGPFPYPFTSYLMLVRGPGTPSERDEVTVPILPPDAVLIVESACCAIPFAEPRDLAWDDLWKGPSPFGKGMLNSLHPTVVKALRADGKVIDIPKDINGRDLQKLLAGTTSGATDE